MKKNLIFLIATILLLQYSCEQPVDSVIEAVDNTKLILRKYDWKLSQFKIKVRNSDIPPPLLFNSSDSLIREGIYDLDDMILDASEMQKYIVNFTDNGKIKTSGGQINLLADDDFEHGYFVFNDRNIRISSAESLVYDYLYDENAKEFLLTVNEASATRVIRRINDKLVDRIAEKTPNKLGDVVASLLFNNEGLQNIINDVLVSAISGKLEFINEFDPDEAARLLAAEILSALQEVDWESNLTQLLKTELEKINNLDPDKLSEDIGKAIANVINENITEDTIFNFILPYIEALVTNSDQVSENISTLIVNLFFEVFDEDVLQPVIASAWRNFTKIEEEQVEKISDTLAYYVQDIWVNTENISNILLPFTQKIDDTSILKMGALATEATESIRSLVNLINDNFPDANLNPDYVSMQSTIKTAFIAAKPAIGIVGGPEAAADGVANLIISQFLNKDNISSVFKSGIEFLQSIDPDLASSTITQWLLSLEEELSPVAIQFLKDLLSPIIDNINPEQTALNIAVALKGFISENITPDSVKTILLPLFQDFVNLNAEEVAAFLAKQIVDLDIIKDIINEENISAILLPVLQSIQETNVEALVQNLINAVVNSGIFEDTITEERVSTIISLLIYKASWDNVLIANNFEEATILLRHE